MKNYRFIWAVVCIIAALVSTSQTALGVAPANNNCANATPIGNVTNQTYSTVDATRDSVYAYSYGVNIWYVYTATCTGTATVSLCGTPAEVDTMLAVYNGSTCPTGTNRIAFNDDDPSGSCGTASILSFSAVCGNQYLIEVGHFSPGVYTSQGKISISCSGTPCSSTPANDTCATAQVVGNVTNLAFNTTGATFDGSGGCVQSGPNIWYRYVATCTGTAVISLCGSSFDTIMAVYSGTSCSNLVLVGCNDDASCGEASQLSVNVTSGKSYWIEVGGFEGSNGAGILNISCNGQVQQASDLGDAPDSTNHYSANMRTYDHLANAQFPTVFQGNAIKGPIHLNPKTKAYLGSSVTYEDEADQGYDQDTTNNILPLQLNANADKDLGDDGVLMATDPFIGKTLAMNHCKLTSFNYTVNVVDPNTDMWVNVWVDWNRDGDWADSGNTDQSLNCTSCNTGGVVNEWAIQNQLLYGLHAGLNTITTPGFLAWYPSTGDKKVWMRVTLSEQPFKGGTGAAGSGPTAGYQYGETEDYYFTPNENCIACEDLNRDGVVDAYDLFTYMLDWLDNCSQ